MGLRELHFYQCRRCKTTATSPVRHSFQRPLCCNMCNSYMKFMWTIPIDRPELEALRDRGVVFNPGTSVDEQTMPFDGSGRR